MSLPSQPTGSGAPDDCSSAIDGSTGAPRRCPCRDCPGQIGSFVSAASLCSAAISRQALGEVERRPLPWLWKITPFGQLTGRPDAKAIDRTILNVSKDGALVRPSALCRTSGGSRSVLQPGAKGTRVQRVGLGIGEDGEHRIDAGFDGPLAEDVGAESVNGVDVRVFERFRPARDVQPRRLKPAPFRSRAPRETRLQLAGCLLGEGDGDDLLISARPVASTRRIRRTSSVVFPVPAAASTTSVSSSASEITLQLRRRAAEASSHRPQRFEILETILRFLFFTRSSSWGPDRAEIAPRARRSAGTAARKPSSTARSTIDKTWRPDRACSR